MPHIPGHPAEEEENNEETGGLSYLMPDTVEEDTKLKSPEQIAEGGGILSPGGASGDTTFSVEEFRDLLLGTTTDPNKPLGTNFQKVYQVKKTNEDGTPDIDPASGLQRVEEVPAEIFLTDDKYQEERRNIFGTGEAFKYIYYQKDVVSQFNALPPYLRIQTKNLLSNAGLINLDKTYGPNIDAETAKGLKLAMDFSMNNNGKLSWLNAAKSMNDYAQSKKVYTTGTYQFTEEDLTDFFDEMVSGAETRKGSSLTPYEKGILMKKLGVTAEDYAASLGDLQPAQPERLDYNPLTGETMFVPAVEAEEPDAEVLTEAGEDVLDEIFAPREALAAKAEAEDDTMARFTRNLRGLAAAESKSAPRAGTT